MAVRPQEILTHQQMDLASEWERKIDNAAKNLIGGVSDCLVLPLADMGIVWEPSLHERVRREIIRRYKEKGWRGVQFEEQDFMLIF